MKSIAIFVACLLLLICSVIGCTNAGNTNAGKTKSPESASHNSASTSSSDQASSATSPSVADGGATSTSSSTSATAKTADPAKSVAAGGADDQTDGAAESEADTANDSGTSQGSSPGSATTQATSTTSAEPIEVRFEEIELPIQADIVFRPFMLTDRVRHLDGKRIRISGYMLPDSKTRNIEQFVLLKNTECKFGPGGQADHLINVLMVEGESTRYREDPITVEGTLKVNPFRGPDGNTWSIYDLACDHVEPFQPRRYD